MNEICGRAPKNICEYCGMHSKGSKINPKYLSDIGRKYGDNSENSTLMWNKAFLQSIIIPLINKLCDLFKVDKSIMDIDLDNNKNTKFTNTIYTTHYPQGGKGNLINVLTFTNRQLHNRVPLVFVNNRRDHLTQFRNRIHVFNGVLKQLLIEIIPQQNVYTEGVDMIFNILMLRGLEVSKKTDLSLFHKAMGYFAMACGNATKLKYVEGIVDYIDGSTIKRKVVIVDEMHSFITDKALNSTVIANFEAILRKVSGYDLAAGEKRHPVYAITATGARIIRHVEIHKYFQLLKILPTDAPYYAINKNLRYRDPYDLVFKAIKQLPLSSLEDDDYKSLYDNLTFFKDDPHTHQKLMLLVLSNLNEEQNILKNKIEAQFKNVFQIYIGNQHSTEDTTTFLNRTDNEKPVIVIGRDCYKQSVSVTPDTDAKRAIMPGITHLLIAFNKDAHDENMIQAAGRACGQFPNPFKGTIMASERDYKKIMLSFKCSKIRNEKMSTYGLFDSEFTMRDLEAEILFPHYPGHQHIRKDLDSGSHKNVTALIGPFENQEKLTKILNTNNRQFELIESVAYSVDFTDRAEFKYVKDLFNNNPMQRKFKNNVFNDCKQRKKPFPIKLKENDEPLNFQVPYNQQRYEDLLKHIVNPIGQWTVQAILGYPDQSLSNVKYCIYRKYLAEHFTDNVYYVFQAPCGQWYASQRNYQSDQELSLWVPADNNFRAEKEKIVEIVKAQPISLKKVPYPKKFKETIKVV